jgi:hypothetical protein
MQHLLVHLP